MAAYNKFNQFVEDIGKILHDLSANTLRLMLTNTSPNAADNVVDTTTTTCTLKATSNAAEIAAASGYAKKGPQATITSWVQTAGTAKLILVDVVVTAAATIGPFRYVVLYNDSGGTTATRPVIAWFDYGSVITLASGETFTIDFDASTGVLTIA